MTDIPGTGKVSPKSTPVEPAQQVENISAVNVSELKKREWEKYKPEDLLWYNRLSYWIAFGALGSIVFVILAFIINKKFIIIAPLCPMIGFVVWHVKKYVAQFEERNKILK